MALKRQNENIKYADIPALQARVGFELNESNEVEVKTVSTTVADLIYNQKNDSTLADDGLISVHSVGDAGGTGSKWIRSDAKAVGTFTATTDVLIEAGAEYHIEGVTATGVKVAGIGKYVFNRVQSLSNEGLELIESPIITADDTVDVRVRNTTNADIPIGEDIAINWSSI